MTGSEYNDLIIRILANSGVRSDELDGLQENFISALRDSSRGEVLNQLYLRNNSVAPIFFQEMYFTDADYKQEGDCVYLFPCPNPLYRPDGSPWVEWVGGSDWNTSANFRVVKSRRELVGANKHHIIGRSDLIRAFYDTNSNVWWVYRNESVESFAVRQINARPYESKEYNIETDTYPFPTDMNDMLMDIILRRYFRQLQGQQDRVPNSIDDKQVANNNQRR
jgi:hypothetical protein